MDAVIIRNPISGNPQRQFAFAKALAVFEQAGWHVDVWVTERKGHSRELAARAVRQGYSTLIVAGGDGSIGQAVDGLLHAGGRDVAFGIIPMGTGNVFAREMGLPFPKSPGDDAPARAARIILHHPPVRIDVGQANGHHFLSWAGVGLDALITEEVESQLEFKRRAPLITYGLTAAKAIWRYRPPQMTVVLDDEETHTGAFPLVIAANIRLYARYFRLSPLAQVNDGLLDVLILTDQAKLKLLFRAAHLVLRPGHTTSGIIRRQVRRLSLTATPPQPYHLDGDPLGQTPLDIRVIPRALRIHLPPEPETP
jgi:YegS/Rv2252/BmrU family lipid kinase